ncbi:sensor histidine kinase [Acidobacteria bacterium ACD]|nr:MAG: sensor histidine kinase [Acidobacteriota bacterium]MCE7960131.1 sensor histidine kinase [Acidobacteria bacterium ACB2]MDL1948348.1 sensor histidine kinase [Acidobacteria bacterium ACD]
MHPLLSSRSRLALYLVAWLPLAGMLAALLTLAGGLSLAEAVSLSVPLSAVYAFVCGSSWYLCRVLPFRPSGVARVVGTFAAAAAIGGFLWVLLLGTLASLLDLVPAFAGLPDRLSRASGVVLLMGTLLYLLVAAFNWALLAQEAAGERERRELVVAAQARAAELKALRDQLDPHFLFNALNSISALTVSDPEKAREMCALLAEFLRKTLGLSDRASIPLEEELSLVRSYLAVEQIRFGERLRVELAVDEDARECGVPPLLLQPLVENAVKHGVSRRVAGGTVRLTARRREALLEIAVENPAGEAQPSPGPGIGLGNVRRRLSTVYGEAASVTVRRPEGLFRVELLLPAGADAA